MPNDLVSREAVMAEKFGPKRFACRYCSRPMRVHEKGYAENPFCSLCYSERLEKASEGMPPMKVVQEGRYFRWIPVDEQEAGDEPGK